MDCRPADNMTHGIWTGDVMAIAVIMAINPDIALLCRATVCNAAQMVNSNNCFASAEQWCLHENTHENIQMSGQRRRRWANINQNWVNVSWVVGYGDAADAEYRVTKISEPVW